jgi:hypothetical protein
MILYLSFIHWVGDFVLQTDKQAKEKSTNFLVLLAHTSTYALCIFVFVELLQLVQFFGAQYWYASLLFAGVQFVTHTIIDYITSRINKKLWDNKEVHTFFVSIGFDQFMHTAILFTSFNIIYG